MSRKSSRIILLAIILMMAVLALAACGGGVNEGEPGPTIGKVIAREVIKVLPTSEPRMPHWGIICPDHNDC